jgi:hypothetical protein
MATLKAHAQQANHNQAFLDSIDPAIFPDWVVTAAFYKAVHLVEGLLVRKGRQSAGHYQRNGVLKRQFAAVWKEYRPLYNLSRTARYLCIPIRPQDVSYALGRLAAVDSAVTSIP